MVEAGYPPRWPYFEAARAQADVDRCRKGPGIARITTSVSGHRRVRRIAVGAASDRRHAKESMRGICATSGRQLRQKARRHVEGGNSSSRRCARRNAEHPIDVVGKKLRDLMSWVERPIPRPP